MTRCPTCGTEGAYVGLNVVECPNPDCACYAAGSAPTESEFERVRRELAEAPDWAFVIPWP